MSNLECLKEYRDICNEIEILTIRKDELESELSIIKRRIYASGPRTKLVASYSGMPGGGSNERPLEETWNLYNAVVEALEDVNDILSLKLEAKKKMENRMSQFNTLEYRVAYMRDIERKRIAKIAAELGYSYDYILKISARVKRVRKAG